LKRPHEKLKVWQLSVELISRLYTLTGKFPDAERYGLTSQIRRSGVSIPANIAEGAARGSDADYLRFLRISRGSLSELETLLLIAKNLHFIDDSDYASSLQECETIGSLLEGLSRRLKASLISEEDPAYDA
jgi:four helix bundle protein